MITIEATYENGVLKPAQRLPLKEHEKVRITIQQAAADAGAVASKGYGLLRWTGSAEDLDYLITDVENDPLERS